MKMRAIGTGFSHGCDPAPDHDAAVALFSLRQQMTSLARKLSCFRDFFYGRNACVFSLLTGSNNRLLRSER